MRESLQGISRGHPEGRSRQEERDAFLVAAGDGIPDRRDWTLRLNGFGFCAVASPAGSSVFARPAQAKRSGGSLTAP